MKKILLFVSLVVGLCSTSFAQMYEHTEAEVIAKYEQCVLISNQVSAANEAYTIDESEFVNLNGRAHSEANDLAESTVGQNYVSLLALANEIDVFSGGPPNAGAQVQDWKETKQTRFALATADDIDAGLAKNNHNWDVAYSKYSSAIGHYSAVLVAIDASNTIFAEMNPKYTAFLTALEGYAYGAFSDANCMYEESENIKYQTDGDKQACEQWFQTTSTRMSAYYQLYGADHLYINTLVPLANDAGTAQSNGDTKHGDSLVPYNEGMTYLGIAETSIDLNKFAKSLDDSHTATSKFNMRKVKLLQAQVYYQSANESYSYLNSILDAL